MPHFTLTALKSRFDQYLTPPTVPEVQGILLGHGRNPMRQPHLRLQFQPPSTFLPIQIHKVSCSDFKNLSFFTSPAVPAVDRMVVERRRIPRSLKPISVADLGY